jgi:hypothetical protein
MYDVSLIVMGGDVKLILIILRFSFWGTDYFSFF